jgi:hypothetical protein
VNGLQATVEQLQQLITDLGETPVDGSKKNTLQTQLVALVYADPEAQDKGGSMASVSVKHVIFASTFYSKFPAGTGARRTRSWP